jgi:DNA-binding PadR family transcriptional regulator
MQEFEDLRHMCNHLVQLTETEHEILKILISNKVGSAYSLHKNSKLNHYSTVLRALKQLERAGYVEARTEISGARGKRLYSLTIIGKVMYYVLRGEKKQIIEILKHNSNRFQDMLNAKLNDIDYWVCELIKGLLLDIKAIWFKRHEVVSIDLRLQYYVEDFFRERLLDLNDQKIQEIREICEIKWIRDFGIKLMSEYSDWQFKQSQMSKNLIGELQKIED